MSNVYDAKTSNPRATEMMSRILCQPTEYCQKLKELNDRVAERGKGIFFQDDVPNERELPGYSRRLVASLKNHCAKIILVNHLSFPLE